MYERCGNSAYNVTPQITKKIPPIPPPPPSLFLSPSPNLNIILDASAKMHSHFKNIRSTARIRQILNPREQTFSIAWANAKFSQPFFPN